MEGKSFRDKTWVVHEEVPQGRWIVGGAVISGATKND